MSKIEWTDVTWNPLAGCSVISPGCKRCYAMRLAARLERMGVAKYSGLTDQAKAGAVWNGKINFDDDALLQPLRWKKPRRIFVNSMSDLFHESVPEEWIDKIFAVMALAPQHTFQVLTKRADRMRAYLTARNFVGNADLCRAINKIEAHLGNRHGALEMPLPNVWLGVSIEDQQRKARIDDLRNTPAALRFLSLEPLLEDLGKIDLTGIGWVIAGGESGPGARPAHPDWLRSLRDQCATAGVSFFFKQWGQFQPDTLKEAIFRTPRVRGGMIRADGTKPTGADLPAMLDGSFDETGYQHFSAVGKKRAGRLLDGIEHNGMPGDRP